MEPVANRRAGAEAFPSTMTVVATVLLLVTGLALGASGPPFLVSFGAGIAAGPTWSGLVLALAILTAIVSGLVGLVVLLVRRRAGGFAAVFVASLGLIVGFFGGTTLGSASDIGGWAPRPRATPWPSFSFPPVKVSYAASGEVTLTLEKVAGFTQPTQEPFADGVFGHWCYSNPEEKTVSEIAALDVGAVGGARLRAQIRLTDPYRDFERWSIAIPRVVISAEDERGVVLSMWAGPATDLESDGASGRLTFADLPVDGAYHAAALPATLSGEATWRCGVWHER
jgi:hypothetical protein